MGEGGWEEKRELGTGQKETDTHTQQIFFDPIKLILLVSMMMMMPMSDAGWPFSSQSTVDEYRSSHCCICCYQWIDLDSPTGEGKRILRRQGKKIKSS